MNRKSLEKKIVKLLSQKVKIDGFDLIEEDYSSKFNHIAVFVKSENDMIYRMRLRFLRPSLLKVQAQFSVYSKQFNEIIQNEIGEVEDNGPAIINFDIDDLKNQHSDGPSELLYLENNGGLDGIEIDVAVDDIYNRYFQFININMMKSISSLVDIEKLVNDVSNINEDEISLSPYCFPRQNQILAGYILSSLIKSNKYEMFMEKYKQFTESHYKDSDHPYILWLRQLIKANNL